MLLEEASKKFCVPLETLQNYEDWGLIHGKKSLTGKYTYQIEHFKNLGLIDTLLKASFEPAEAKKYLQLGKNPGTCTEQIHMLKKARRQLFEQIRSKQKILDKIDFIIWNKKSKLNR